MSRILAFDFGASSGRAMLGQYKDGKITIKELHRFTNDPVNVRGTLYWDVLRLLYDMKKGIVAAVNDGGFDSIGVDTWGVDFGMIGFDGQLVQNPVHYRDNRTDGWDECPVSKDEVYAATGIQQMQINTINQLDYMVRNKPEMLERTDKILFMPDLLNYFLTGVMKCEYTEASTSQMLDAHKRDWNYELLEKVSIPSRILLDLVKPGTLCGKLSDDICEELGAPKADVVCVASHDTASAVASVPSLRDDFIYISSGTWSLLGTELKEPIINEKAKSYNFTNEGGVNNTIRFLKNIMGTWLIQESRRQWIREGSEYGFGELEAMARESKPFRCFIDVDSDAFIKPGNLPRRIREFCKKTGQYEPQTPGEVVRCIDESLAMKYKENIEAMKDLTGKHYETIHIVGGGGQSALLCQMAADASGMEVIAGPTEATVLGNIAVQLMARGELKNIQEVREAVIRSSELKEYKSENQEEWEQAYKTYKEVTGE